MTEVTLAEALRARRSHRDYLDQPVSRLALERALWAGQGATDAEGRRCAPSAHGVHPLRLRLAARQVIDLQAGLYAASARITDKPLARSSPHDALAAAAIGDQPWVARSAAVIGIGADLRLMAEAFLEQPPYGARGERYALLETGAAAQNMLLQLAADGLGGVLVAGYDDSAASDALMFGSTERALALICVGVIAPKQTA